MSFACIAVTLNKYRGLMSLLVLQRVAESVSAVVYGRVMPAGSSLSCTIVWVSPQQSSDSQPIGFGASASDSSPGRTVDSSSRGSPWINVPPLPEEQVGEACVCPLLPGYHAEACCGYGQQPNRLWWPA